MIEGCAVSVSVLSDAEVRAIGAIAASGGSPIVPAEKVVYRAILGSRREAIEDASHAAVTLLAMKAAERLSLGPEHYA